MKKWSNIFNRKTCIGLFALVFLLAGIFIVENRVAHAENTPYVDSSTDFISEEKDISTDGGVPVASGEYADWLFAGWYSEQTCKDESVISNTTDVTKAWAKFVPADVLTVKCQVKSDVQSEGVTSTNMRLITSVDTLNYNKVGFKVIYNNGAEKDVWTQTVYSRIKASAESGVDYNYSPKVVDTKSEWFVTATLININKNNYNNTFLIKPYWVTYDGTTVYGTSKYVTVADSYSDVVSLPVKVDSEATLNSLSVTGETIKEIRYSENGAGWGAIVLEEDKSALPSLTKYTISDGQVAYWRNLNTVYNGDNADKSWYEAISDEKEFVIATNADLYGLPMLVNSTDAVTFNGKIIYLCADIEANKGEAAETGWDAAKVGDGTEHPWTPIGTSSAFFNGTFDGQGHTISGICTKQDYRAALFAWTGSNSVFKNFILTNSYFEGKEYNGSIAGRLDGSLYNISSDAIVKGSNSTNGGLVGYVYAPTTGKSVIKECCFAGSVQTGLTEADLKNFAGGMVGALWQGNLEVVNCEVTGTVGATQYYAGGILGGLNNGEATATIDIKDCRFAGTINNTKGHSGGIIGSAYENTDTINIINCSVEGEINAGDRSGGLIGQIGGGKVTIDESSFAGNLNAPNNYYAGGLVGIVVGGTVNINQSSLEETGKVFAKETAGGLVGYAMGGTVTIDNSSVSGEVASTWSTGGLVSRVANGTVEIKNSSFAEAGKVTTGNFSGGLIGRVESGTVNIDYCHANSMTAPGTHSGGIIGYVGGGNVTISDTYYEGTFESTSTGISGFSYVGGHVGYIEGGSTVTLEDSFFDGKLQSKAAGVGGIVGFITQNKSGETPTVAISRCYSKGEVISGSSHTGGLVGGATYLITEVSLTDCLNEASVTGTAWVGGLLGRTHISNTTTGNIQMTRCLNIGTISTTNSSTSVGSAIGKAEIKAPVVTSTYAVTTDTVKQAYGTGSTTCGVTTCTLPEITVGNGVTVDAVKSKLSGLFTAENTIWTIGTTEGSTPKLDLTK